jgi:hypothetical protein
MQGSDAAQKTSSGAGRSQVLLGAMMIRTKISWGEILSRLCHQTAHVGHPRYQMGLCHQEQKAGEGKQFSPSPGTRELRVGGDDWMLSSVDVVDTGGNDVLPLASIHEEMRSYKRN